MSDGAWKACFHLKHLQPDGRVNEEIVMPEHDASMLGCNNREHQKTQRGVCVCVCGQRVYTVCVMKDRKLRLETASLANTIWVRTLILIENSHAHK